MKLLRTTYLFATVFLISGITPSFSQSPEQLYQKGLIKEEGEGNLNEAIGFYNEIVENPDANKSLQAKALLHVGLCYEKLGRDEATKAYQQLVNNFPGQESEVAIARARLSILIQASQMQKIDPEVNPKSMTLQKVWSGPSSITSGAPSPDGRFLTYSDPGTDNLALRVLSTGKSYLLTNEATYEDPMQLSMGSIVSPNSKQIAYSWYKNNFEIRLVDVDNPQPKVLYSNKDEDVYPCVWSPDGKIIYAKSYLNKTRQCRILAITVESGDVQILKTFNFFYWLHLSVSPDNRFIAYDLPNVNDGVWSDTDVHLISTDGKIETSLIKHPANDHLLGWCPDKNQILIKSDRSGTWDAWTVSVLNGKVAGEPRRVLTEIGETASQMGFTENGTFYYSLISRKFNAFTAPLDQINGELKIELNKPFLGSIRHAEWSPDGKSLAFIKEVWSLSRRPLFIMDLETGKERNLSNLLNVWQLRWSPDSKTLLLSGYDERKEQDKDYRGGIYAIEVSSGKITELLAFSNAQKNVVGVEWSDDQKSIYYIKNDQLIIRELASGKEKTSLQNQKFSKILGLSPDEKKLLFCADDQIYVIPTSGGNLISVVGVVTSEGGGPTVHNSAIWSPDGNYIFFTENKGTDGSVLWRISTEGKNPKEVWQSKVPISSLSIHPDGQKIVITTLSQESEIWQAENLLSLEKIAQINETEDLLIRKVLADTEIEPLGAPSPDGRYISFVDWDSGSNLSILDLETKKRQRLTDFKNPEEQAYYSSWSPDGKKIAYFWWDKIGYNLSIIDLNESKSRVLLKSEKVNWIELGNWSSDGNYILATLWLDGNSGCQIVRISTTDGSIKTLKSFDKSNLGGKPWFSPDGRYVAYDLPDDKASGNSDIYLFSLEDDRENALFKHPSHDYILGWTPDGKNILFASDRTGTVDAMTIRVEEGKSIGQPKTVQSNIGLIVPMGFTQKGAFYYGQWPGARNIYSAEIDFETGKILSQPTLAIKRFEGKNRTPSYSNNGKYLAYISKRGVIRIGKPGTLLCIRELETGEEYEIIPPYDIANSVSYPTWSPDDGSIALMCRKDGQQKIYNFNIQTKKFTPLVTGTNDEVSDADYIYPQWSKDGKTVYYFQLSESVQTSYIMAMDIETGIKRELFQYSSDNFMDRIFNISLSPDGKWIAAINRGENRFLKVFSMERGISHDLYSFKSPGGGSFPQIWSKDGKYIIYAYNTKEGGWNLMRIPIDGGEKLEIEMNIFGISSPSLHPDGRHLSFSSAGYSPPKNNIWEMKNFLPKEETINAQK